eukprot:358384-Chlamydomonas_euryale.AAC.3
MQAHAHAGRARRACTGDTFQTFTMQAHAHAGRARRACIGGTFQTLMTSTCQRNWCQTSYNQMCRQRLGCGRYGGRAQSRAWEIFRGWRAGRVVGRRMYV